MSIELLADLHLLERVARSRAAIGRALAALDTADPARRSVEAMDLVASHPELRALGSLLRSPVSARRDLLVGTPLSADEVDQVLQLSRELEALGAARQALARAMPFSMPPAASAEWTSYRAQLLGEARKPVLGGVGAVPLEELYVPARFALRRCARDHDRRRLLESIPSEPSEIGDDALARVEALLAADDAPVFVLGPPGSGKSAFAQMLASRLAAGHWHPVFMRLRHVDDGQPVLEQIRAHLRAAGGAEPWTDLAARFEQAPDVVLVLDGFDELGGAGREGQQGFFLRVMEVVRELGLRVVLTGRDTLLVRETAFPRGSTLLGLLEFDDRQVAEWCDRWTRATGSTFDVAHHLAGPDGLGAILRQPLLLYLLAFLEHAGLQRPELGGDPAHIFRQILSQLCARHAAARPGASLTAPRLRRLLGLAGWVSMLRGSAQIGREDLQRAVELHFRGAAGQVDDLVDGTLLSFYFRRVHANEWEFTHKSFGEYLAAEHIAGAIHRLTERRIDPLGESSFVLDDGVAAEHLIETLGPAVVPDAVEKWLPAMLAGWPAFLEGRAGEPAALEIVESRLLSFVPRLLDEDDAETALRVARAWGVMPRFAAAQSLFNVAALAGLAADGLGRRVELEALCGGDWTSFFKLVSIAADSSGIQRLTGRAVARDLSYDWMEGLDQTSSWGLRIENGESSGEGMLFGVGLDFGVLAGNFLHWVFLWSSFQYADCTDADFTDADFESVALYGADFRGSKLTRASFRDCDLEGATFDRAVLQRARLDCATTFTQLDGRLDAEGYVLPAYLDDEGRFHPDGAPGKALPRKKASKRRPR